MNVLLLVAVIILCLFLAFVLLAVFCSLAIAQKADDNDRALNDDGSCEWCGSADDVTCKECKARRGAK